MNVDHVSRADWWALAGIAGVDFLLNKSSIHQNGPPRIVDYYCGLLLAFYTTSNHRQSIFTMVKDSRRQAESYYSSYFTH